MSKKFSLILTTYNDAEVLAGSIPEIEEFLRRTDINYEIVIVDDGSDRHNKTKLKELQETRPDFLIHSFEINRGRGAAVKKGLELSSGDYAGFIDNDLEIPVHYLLPMLIDIEKGADIVIARRIYKMELKNTIRYIFTSGYHYLVNFTLKIPGYDTETGCKLFRRAKILPLLEYTKNDRWFWDTEIIYFGHKFGLKIKEINIALNKKYNIPSSVSFISDIIEYLKNLKNLYLSERRNKLR